MSNECEVLFLGFIGDADEQNTDFCALRSLKSNRKDMHENT